MFATGKSEEASTKKDDSKDNTDQHMEDLDNEKTKASTPHHSPLADQSKDTSSAAIPPQAHYKAMALCQGADSPYH